jgi:hypothetical protein
MNSTNVRASLWTWLNSELAAVGATSQRTRDVLAVCGSLGLDHRLAELTKQRVETRVGMPFARLLPQPMAATIRSARHVIHARDDREVPFADGAAIAPAAPDGCLLATSGLGYRRILRDRQVIETTADFCRGAPAPQGVYKVREQAIPHGCESHHRHFSWTGVLTHLDALSEVLAGAGHETAVR